jgi:hypothetical protein
LVEGAKRVGDRDRRIRLMQLIQVDAIGPEPSEAILEGLPHVLGACPLSLRIDPHAELRGDNRGVTAGRQRASEKDFALGCSIDIGGIKESHTGVEGRVNHPRACLGIDPHAEVVATEANN